MLRSITLWGVRAQEKVEYLKHKENVTYRDRSRVLELLLQLENKQQIMQNNGETQHKHMYSLNIGSLCNVAFPMARFTCIVTSQVFVEIWIRWSCLLYGQKILMNSLQLQLWTEKKNTHYVPLISVGDFVIVADVR